MTLLGRRQLLGVMAALGWVGVASSLGCPAETPVPDEVVFPPNPYAFLAPEIAAAERLGKRWLEGRRSKPGPAELLESVIGQLDPASADPDEVHATVREKVQADFAKGKTEWLADWLLSKTELRVCAYLWLTKHERTPAPQAELEPGSTTNAKPGAKFAPGQGTESTGAGEAEEADPDDPDTESQD